MAGGCRKHRGQINQNNTHLSHTGADWRKNQKVLKKRLQYKNGTCKVKGCTLKEKGLFSVKMLTKVSVKLTAKLCEAANSFIKKTL